MNFLRRKIICHVMRWQKYKLLYPHIASKRPISYLGKWEMPEGYDTGITIYNSAVNKKVPLILKQKNLATWYICGPTVYAESHIGHASCYIKFDIIRRILENIFDIKVMVLLGITDIDDKIIKRSNEAGVSAFHLAKKYELEFFQDMEDLRVLPPTATKRVSDNIPFIISFCEKLIETEFAYVTEEGNVYFKVCKGVTASVLNEMPQDIFHEGRSDPLKKDHRDFAVWKASKANEPFWESPWGRGRPGWHIECSAIASKMFGSSIDLHSGGYDLLFPHHANEKSQSEAFHGCSQWVNYWLHAGLLNIGEDTKMSKSLGNTISIKSFLKENDANDIRILCLQSLYRKNLSYCPKTLSGAKSLHEKLHNFINECESYISMEIGGSLLDETKLLTLLTSTKQKILNILENDFNTSQALLCLTDFIDEVNKSLPPPNATDPARPSSISTIAMCCFYVNDILQKLGISILTKKKLPKQFLFAVDSINDFRNKMRHFALNPQSCSLKEDEKCAHFVNKCYDSLNENLHIIYESKELPREIEGISKDCQFFYEKSHEFATILDQEITLQLLYQLNLKEARKKMIPLFTICDKFRSSLLQKGIIIKDRHNMSSWVPSIDLKRTLYTNLCYK